MEEENLDQALYICIQLKREGNISRVVNFSEPVGAHCMYHPEQLQEITWASLCKVKGTRTAPERNTSALSTITHFMSVAMPDVYRNKCVIVYFVLNWNAWPVIRRVICSGHLPVWFAPMRKSVSVTWSTIPVQATYGVPALVRRFRRHRLAVGSHWFIAILQTKNACCPLLYCQRHHRVPCYE